MNTHEVPPAPGDALLVVDVQVDFLPGGALAVPHGDEVIAPLNRWIERFVLAGQPIYATRDWHPQAHRSFREQGGVWPTHCVSGSSGASFAAALALPPSAIVISKADAVERDAYSGFSGTDLGDRLISSRVARVCIGGLATDYCVLHTVLDARAAGFEVVVIEDAVRAVDLRPGDGTRALERMRAAGALMLREG